MMKTGYTAEELRDRFPEICGGELPEADVVDMVNLTLSIADKMHKAYPKHTTAFFIDVIMKDMEQIATGHPERAVVLVPDDDDTGEEYVNTIPT
ncbi:MAG: hypothetical protein IJ119_15935 [Clostridia bacterium]|nr:hypothetical protein [Clostridia bacterium]